MNIFGVGEVEFVLIILIALIIAGPKRLIEWMYILGKWVAKLRVLWQEAVVVMQKELDASGVDVQLPKDLPTRQNIAKTVTSAMKPLTQSVAQPMKEALNEVKSVSNEFQTTAQEAKKQLDGVKTDVKKVSTISNGTTPLKTTDQFQNIVKPNSTPTPPTSPTPPATTNGSSMNFGTWSGSNPKQDTDSTSETGA